MFKITIVAVDGETHFSCVGSKKACLGFLQQHDHEGSSIWLERDGADVLHDSDAVYAALGYVPEPTKLELPVCVHKYGPWDYSVHPAGMRVCALCGHEQHD